VKPLAAIEQASCDETSPPREFRRPVWRHCSAAQPCEPARHGSGAESRWAVKRSERFLLENVLNLAALFPKNRVKTVCDYGFEGRDDRAVAQLAGVNDLILVTN
jgi:hypothetical protein